MELEWELDVDLGAGMGAAVELLYNTRYTIPACYTIPAWPPPKRDFGPKRRFGPLEARQMPFDSDGMCWPTPCPPARPNAILAENGVSGPWRPASPIENATLEALFKTGKWDVQNGGSARGLQP